MSAMYCQFENGVDEMRGVLTKLIDGQVSDWSVSEIRSLRRIFELAEQIAEYKESTEEDVR